VLRIDSVEDRVDVFLAHAFRLVLGPVGLATVGAAILCLVAGRTLLGRNVRGRLRATWVGAGGGVGRHLR